MGDLGYFKLTYFDEINASGGCYLARSKTLIKPNVIAGFNKKDQRVKRFSDKSLVQLKKHIR